MRSLTLLLLFAPICAALNDSEKIVSCYTRHNSPFPSQIDPFLCTHLLVIGSTHINANCTPDMPDERQIESFVALKLNNSDLKVFLSLTPSNPTMSRLVLNKDLLDAYVANVTEYLVENELDGFDLDWEFPVWSSDAKPTDKQGLNALVKAFRKSFDSASRPLQLSLAVSGPFTIAKVAYDIPALNEYLDFVQIMNYDFHDYSSTTPFTGFNAPLNALRYEFSILRKFNSNYSAHYYRSKGLSSEKCVFGIPTYGHGYQLLAEGLHFPYAPATGESKRFGGDLGFDEVCAALNSNKYTSVWSEHAKSPYFYGEKQWVSYEDVRSVSAKAQYARDEGFRGIMIFDLPTDDFEGKCGLGEYPLIRAAKKAFLGV